MLLPDRLRMLWREVDAGRSSKEAALARQERELDVYREEWESTLLLPEAQDLRESLLREVAVYYGMTSLSDVERLCAGAVEALRNEWEQQVNPRQRESIEGFYQSATMIYDLMGWHSLQDDTGPLAYVLGLEIARERHIRDCLDFGSGVGSGALLFSRAGVRMTLADISTTLLDFCRWRFARRQLSVDFLNLNEEQLPAASFDMILAMDVFEHLVDPVATIEHVWRTLRPGGLFFARIHVENSGTHPQHIVRDFEPTFTRMRELGLVEVWRDTWLWGHQLFEKRAG